MGKKIREFMTHREPPEHIWMEREESAVIGTARMGQRLVPKIRPFDLLRSTPLTGNRARAMVFEGDSLRIATEYLAGPEAQLTRAADHDIIYLQFSGRSTIESESGVVEVAPGEIVLVPRRFPIAPQARTNASAYERRRKSLSPKALIRKSPRCREVFPCAPRSRCRLRMDKEPTALTPIRCWNISAFGIHSPIFGWNGT
jgi:hypothetical protein